jgi:thiamine biosynthesis lipoprotein
VVPQLVLDKRTIRLILIAFVLLAALTLHRLWFAEVPLESDLLVIDGETMGTTYQIRIAGDELTEGLRAEVERETGRRLAEVDALMSNWNPDSEISRFNAHRETDDFAVSFETADLVAFAVEVSKWTSGAFDITVAPLVSAWGFGSRANVGPPPSQEEIDRLLQRTGPRVLRIGRGNPKDGGFLRKEIAEATIDLSAIAKGYGVDHVAGGLFALGREDFMVEIGGEVYAAGQRPGGGPWRIAVEKPIHEGRSIQIVIELQDRALATSGDYRIFYEADGRRISHTIDPRTGRPVENGPASATAMAASATVADAWATALMVMGHDGLELAEREGVAALLIWRGEDGDLRMEKNALFPDEAAQVEAARAVE